MMWWLAMAQAGSVFVNEVRVNPEDLHGTELKGVTVTADAQGNLHISAPGYTVRLAETAPVAPPTPRPAPKAVAAVPSGTWWLHVEDSGSRGHTVDIQVNGVVVTTIRSGDETPVKDIGRWLRMGPNPVKIIARSTGASGGPLYVFLGRGVDRSGTVDMGKPAIQFGVGKSRSGLTTRDYTLEVN